MGHTPLGDYLLYIRQKGKDILKTKYHATGAYRPVGLRSTPCSDSLAPLPDMRYGESISWSGYGDKEKIHTPAKN